jgi:DNA-binding response OmpR family regulator
MVADADAPVERGEILLVEDEKTLAGAIRYALQKEGYRTRWAADGAAALEAFRSHGEGGVDLVLLDLMLPVIDGLEVCRAIRQESSVPIMMLTAKTSELDVVLGLELGADDYLAKPFGMRELVARVRALLRRASAPAGSDRPIAVGHLKILPGQRRVLRDGAPVPLRPREFDLLLFLARNRGHVFTRDQLLERVWGFDFLGESRTVDVHVRLLRTKLELDPAQPALLQTVRHVGYCLA